jgi:hypothetical protein
MVAWLSALRSPSCSSALDVNWLQQGWTCSSCICWSKFQGPKVFSTCPCFQVSRVARMMVSQMGFSKKLGQVAWSSSGGSQFLGAQMAQPSDCSGATQDVIDGEVKVCAWRLRQCALAAVALSF